jgi:hypothetical protein
MSKWASALSTMTLLTSKRTIKEFIKVSNSAEDSIVLSESEVNFKSPATHVKTISLNMTQFSTLGTSSRT